MSVNIIIFGQLTDITGTDELILDNIADSDSLVAELHRLYPSLQGMDYLLAVNKQVVAENTMLHAESTVALLPPFSGG